MYFLAGTGFLHGILLWSSVFLKYLPLSSVPDTIFWTSVSSLILIFYSAYPVIFETFYFVMLFPDSLLVETWVWLDADLKIWKYKFGIHEFPREVKVRQ